MTAPRWLAADWPAPPGVFAATTLRQGGVSEGGYASLNLGSHVGDRPDRVAENRRRIGEALGLPSEPLWLRQEHGTTVVRAGEAPPGTAADAAVTSRSGEVCAVLTADCLPIVLADSKGQEVAAAHAGWRGLCNGIVEATVAAMTADPGRLMAWLGPAISAAAFEVGDEVREAFMAGEPAAAAHFRPNARGRWQADMYGLARERLQSVGVRRIFGGGRCTFGEPEAFFSWRRDGECGRMATLVWKARQGPPDDRTSREAG